MLSQMDPALVSFCEKIADEGFGVLFLAFFLFFYTLSFLIRELSMWYIISIAGDELQKFVGINL